MLWTFLSSTFGPIPLGILEVMQAPTSANVWELLPLHSGMCVGRTQHMGLPYSIFLLLGERKATTSVVASLGLCHLVWEASPIIHLPPCSGQGNAPGNGCSNALLPTAPDSFLSIIFERYIYHCILHENMHPLIYNTMVL